MDNMISTQRLYISGVSKHSLYPGIVGAIVGLRVVRFNVKDTSKTSVPTLSTERLCFKVKYDDGIAYINTEDVMLGHYETF